jgi:hypothetical protein
MSAKLTSLVAAHYIFLARSFSVILGCAAVCWGIVEFPVFWRESSTERIANRIIAGEPFKVDILIKQLSIEEGSEKSANCRPAAVRNAALIRLQLMEERSLETSLPVTNTQAIGLQLSLEKALACAPSNPFFWTVLYWSASQISSRVPVEYLRLSYKLGPNEGWIALKRNRLAFTLFEKLPADLQKNAIMEFVRLLSNDFEPNSGLYTAVLNIFIGPAWHVRDDVTPYLTSLPKRNRENFARDLYAKGYSVAIPGVKQPELTR